jgi:hypothetical protein
LSNPPAAVVGIRVDSGPTEFFAPARPPSRRRERPVRAALIKELAEYLGHSDPAFTLRVYAHMLPCSYDRARAVINDRFTRAISADA